MGQYIVDSNVLLKFYCELQRSDVLHQVLGGVTVAERVKREFEYHGFGPGKEDFARDVAAGRVRSVDVSPAEEAESPSTKQTLCTRVSATLPPSP
jgi:hypothetical protein